MTGESKGRVSGDGRGRVGVEKRMGWGPVLKEAQVPEPHRLLDSLTAPASSARLLR